MLGSAQKLTAYYMAPLPRRTWPYLSGRLELDALDGAAVRGEGAARPFGRPQVVDAHPALGCAHRQSRAIRVEIDRRQRGVASDRLNYTDMGGGSFRETAAAYDIQKKNSQTGSN